MLIESMNSYRTPKKWKPAWASYRSTGSKNHLQHEKKWKMEDMEEFIFNTEKKLENNGNFIKRMKSNFPPFFDSIKIIFKPFKWWKTWIQKFLFRFFHICIHLKKHLLLIIKFLNYQIFTCTVLFLNIKPFWNFNINYTL